MDILPPTTARVACAAPWALVAAGSVVFGASSTDVLSRCGAGAVLALGAILAVRGYRLGVRCEADRLVVRGLLRTRVIPRRRIRAVTGFPAVRWVTGAGRVRWTPVTAFMSGGGELASVRAAKAQCLARLRRWARVSGGGPG